MSRSWITMQWLTAELLLTRILRGCRRKAESWQGIGMTLYENIQYTEKGQLLNNSFMQYKIPTRMDMGNLHVEFESSYEPTGPFGAKSIGEIVINTPAPALTHAIANATGLWFRELPITSEQIAMGIMENEN